MPSMTRQHFIKIAETIRYMNVDAATREKVAREFADALRSTNWQFKEDLFVQVATGVAPVNARVAR